MLPYYIQPPCISAHDNPLGFYIQELSNLDLIFFHCHFSKRSQMLHALCILIVEQSVWWFCSVWSHHYIIQICCCGNDLTQKFSFSFTLMPACINIVLALPTSVGIFLSTTEFCWGVPGAVNSKITSRFCLSHSFWRLLFSPLLSSLIFYLNSIFLDSPLIHIGII